jgi:hypothetical protein
MTSWEVRLATALAWLGVLPGFGCLYLSYLAFTADPGFLFVVLPIVFGALLMAGVFLVGAAVNLALRLQRRDPGARLRAFLAGGLLALSGLGILLASPLAGLSLLLYGGTLLWLMTTPSAARELGPYVPPTLRPQAPWGHTPGTALWAPAAPGPGLHPSVPPGPVQGPWAPDPTTLPWFSWKDHSGPRAPWWQTWQAGLAQGIPLWELVVLVASMVAFGVGLVAVLVPDWRPFALVLVPAPLGVVALLEQRMRVRLARH